MNRRAFIAAAATAAVAGCSSPSTAAPDDAAPPTPPEPTPEPTPADEVELLEHELVANDITGSAYLRGTVRNSTGHELRYISVSVLYYDADGVRIGRGLDVLQDIAPGERLAFEAISTTPFDDIEEYDIYLEARR